MKRKWKIVPKYIMGLLGSALVVLVVQYSLLTGLIEPVHPIFVIMQMFCYMLLGVAVFRGFIQRSKLAWLVSQIMLSALFAISILFTTFGLVYSLESKGFLIMLGAALFSAVLNGLMLGFLFSLPVCDYFKASDEED